MGEHRLDEFNAAEELRVKQAERALKRMQARLNADVSPLETFEAVEPEKDEETADKKKPIRNGKPEVSGDVGGGTSSDEESVTPSSGSETDDDDQSDSDSESWGKVSLQDS